MSEDLVAVARADLVRLMVTVEHWAGIRRSTPDAGEDLDWTDPQAASGTTYRPLPVERPALPAAGATATLLPIDPNAAPPQREVHWRGRLPEAPATRRPAAPRSQPSTAEDDVRSAPTPAQAPVDSIEPMTTEAAAFEAARALAGPRSPHVAAAAHKATPPTALPAAVAMASVPRADSAAAQFAERHRPNVPVTGTSSARAAHPPSVWEGVTPLPNVAFAEPDAVARPHTAHTAVPRWQAPPPAPDHPGIGRVEAQAAAAASDDLESRLADLLEAAAIECGIDLS